MKKLILFILIFSQSSFSQNGKPVEFTEMQGSRQSALKTPIAIICIDSFTVNGAVTIDTLHVIKNNPVFKYTKTSLFTNENIKDIYFLLTEIDSSKLYIQDCDISLLKFLKLKTSTNNLKYAVIDSSVQFVNNEVMRVIEWKKPVELFLFEGNLSYPTTFSRWTEFWRCGDKLDYAPAYAFMYPEPTTLVKENTKAYEESIYYLLTNPILVLSAVPLTESDGEWLFALHGKSRKTTLKTKTDKEIAGRSIDLNEDNIPDAFWFIDVLESKKIEWIVRLYLNIEGNWTPVWYQYFNEFH